MHNNDTIRITSISKTNNDDIINSYLIDIKFFRQTRRESEEEWEKRIVNFLVKQNYTLYSIYNQLVAIFLTP